MTAPLTGTPLGFLPPLPSTAGGSGINGIGDSITSGTATRVLFEDTGPVLADSSAFTFDKSTGTVSATLLKATGLTAGRVTFAGTGGLLTDDADLTFATDTLTATKMVASTAMIVSGLTAGRVTFAGAAGLLTDDADLTFATDTLTATNVAITSLTSGRVPFAGAAGLLGDASTLTFAAGILTASAYVASTSTTPPVQSTITDGAAAAQLEALRLRHTTSITATAGIGSYISFWAHDAAATIVELADVVGMARTVGAGTHNGIVALRTAVTGAAPTVSAHTVAGALYGASALAVGTLSATGVSTGLMAITIASSMVNYSSSSSAQGGHNFSGTANTSGARQFFTITPSANTSSTAATEVQAFEYQTYTHQFASNTGVTNQREFCIKAPTYAFASATGTITNAATVYIDQAPIVGTNAAITNPYALWVDAGTSRFDGQLDLSAISAGSPNFNITATSDTPGTTFNVVGTNNASAAPSGFVEIVVGGNARYIPFYA